jgi:prophage regulatory protein
MTLLDQASLKGLGINYTNEHLRRLEAADRFPKRVKLGDAPNSRNAWAESEVLAWINARAAARELVAA